MDAKVADLQKQLEKLANETRRDEKDASRKLDEAAGSIRDKRIREKIRYYEERAAGHRLAGDARGMEDDITANLDALQKKIGEPPARSASSRSRTRSRARRTRPAISCAAWSRMQGRCRMATAAGRKGPGPAGTTGNKAAGQEGKGQQGKSPGAARPAEASRVSKDTAGSAGPAGSAGSAGQQGGQGHSQQGGQNGRRRREQRRRRRRTA